MSKVKLIEMTDDLRHIFKCLSILLAIVISMQTSSAIASERILYNDKFDDHYKPNFMTEFGNPKFVKSRGDSIINSLELSCSPLIDRSHRNEFTPYDQISYPIDSILSELNGLGKVHYKIQIDFKTHGLIGSKSELTICLDVPDVRRVDFENNGKVGINGSKYVDKFADDEIIRCEIDVDTAKNKLIVNINNRKVYEGLLEAEMLGSVRISQQKHIDCDEPATTNIYNVKISVVPDEDAEQK